MSQSDRKPLSNEDELRMAYLLQNPRTRPTAIVELIVQLKTPFSETSANALLELICLHSDPTVVCSALNKLAEVANAKDHQQWEFCLKAILDPTFQWPQTPQEPCVNRSVAERILAIQLVEKRRDIFEPAGLRDLFAAIENLLFSDPSWQVRKACINALAGRVAQDSFDKFCRLGSRVQHDPHWRVRGAYFEQYEKLVDQLAIANPHSVENRFSEFLQLIESGAEICEPPIVPNPMTQVPFWDWSPAVLIRNLAKLSNQEIYNACEIRSGNEINIDVLPSFLRHGEESVRQSCRNAIAEFGSNNVWMKSLAILAEPFSFSDNWELVERLSEQQIGELLSQSPEADFPKGSSSGQEIEHEIGIRSVWILLAETHRRQIHLEKFQAILQHLADETSIRFSVRSKVVAKQFVKIALNNESLREIDAEQWESTCQILRQLLTVQFNSDSDIENDLPTIAAELVIAFSRCLGSTDSTKWLNRFINSDYALVRKSAMELFAIGDIEHNATNDRCSHVRLVAAQKLKKLNENIDQQTHPQWSLAIGSQMDSLSDDDNPLVRSAVLSLEQAQQIVANPRLESSIFVIEQACKLCKTSMWRLAPSLFSEEQSEPDEPNEETIGRKPNAWQSNAEPLNLTCNPAPGSRRRLHVLDEEVSAIGISGHYHLPTIGFQRAFEAGVNLMFWEPNYHTLNRFSESLSVGTRRQIKFLAGTFEATSKKIEQDLERALRRLRIECLDIFMLFWTRSWNRIDEEVLRIIQKLKSSGKVKCVGLSTHNQQIALRAIREGWDPVMVRHSVAFRRHESETFQTAMANRTSLITFNNTCYGRLIGSHANSEITATDCYLYSLSFDAVTCGFSAPATLEQLEENLYVLTRLESRPFLSSEKKLALLERGRELYRREKLFKKWIIGE